VCLSIYFGLSYFNKNNIVIFFVRCVLYILGFCQASTIEFQKIIANLRFVLFINSF
jgi:hypothetical protein